MCRDMAPKQMNFYLGLLDGVEKMESEVKTALTYSDDQDHCTDLKDTLRFLEERRMMMESMVGNLNDSHILVTPYAELLRSEQHDL